MAHHLVGRTVFVLIATFATTPVTAQTVRGRVVDAESNRPLRAANITLLDDQSREVARASTDSAGTFELRAPRPAGYRLRATLFGYATQTSDRVELRARETVQVALQLATQPIPVVPLVIVTRERGHSRLDEFEQRRTKLGTGYFLTRNEIDKRPLATASTLLLDLPGVILKTLDDGHSEIRLRSNRITGSAEETCRANLYVDGHLRSGSVDDFLITDWVGGVEVYPRPGTAPAGFRSDNACGVVLFWTQDPERGANWRWAKIAAVTAFVVGAALVTR